MSDPTELHISPQIAAIVNGALDSGNVLLLAAVDADRKPIMSFRGSAAVFGDTQLSFWARNVAGGTIAAIRQNPNVAFMYRSKEVPLLQFSGRARVAETGGERDRAYEIMHERERQSDPERKGLAVIVEVDEIKGVLIGADGERTFHHMVRG